MRDINALLAAAILSLASPALAQYAQSPEQPQAPPPAAGDDRLEHYLWEGAVRRNTPEGYRIYLQRYSQGPHADQARDQLDRFAGRAPAPTQYEQQPSPGYSSDVAMPSPAPAEPALPPAAEPVLPSSAPMGMVPPPAVAPPLPTATTPAPAVSVATRAAIEGSPLFLCRPVFATGTPPFEQAEEAEIAAYFQALKVNSVAAYETYLKAFPSGVFAPAVTELVAKRQARARALAAMTVPGPSQAHPRSPVTITPVDFPQGVTTGGSATAVWEVAEDGCVQYCRIEKSSGTPALDAATCRAVSARGGYYPARDGAGKPIRSIETGTFTWAPPAR